MRRFLQLFLDALGQLLRNLLRGGAWPEGADNHQLEGERRVFRLAQLPVGEDAHQGDGEQKVTDQRAVMERPVRQVEAGIHFSAVLRV